MITTSFRRGGGGSRDPQKLLRNLTMIFWSMGLMSMSYEADEQAATNRSQQRDAFNLSFAADPVFLSTLSSISFNVQNIFLLIYLEWQVGSGLENESTMIFLRLMRHFSQS